MSGLRNILAYKPAIDERIQAVLENKGNELTAIHAWGSDAVVRLKEFMVSGKTIRGALVVYTYTRFYPTAGEPVFSAAAGMEFLHAGLLIHDDIMDEDALRRGRPSMHKQYESVRDSDVRFGRNMAINVGDLCFFMAFGLLPQTLAAKVASELQYVVVGQMQDVASIADKPYTKEQVLSLYRYKTARYTFSLPMAIGAILAGASAPTVSRLEALGEHMGLLFQLRDDELSDSGNSAVTGKPTGSDEKNAKLTLSRLLPADEFKSLKVSLQQETLALIQEIPYSPTHKSELTELMQFLVTRDK